MRQFCSCLLAICLYVSYADAYVNGNSLDAPARPRLQDASFDVAIPNLFSTGVQVVKQVPYVEMLRLVEACVKLKGEVAGRMWALINDNSHIFSALLQTLVSKLSTVHKLTLTAIVVVRKIVEFAAALFGQINVGFGVNSPFFNSNVNFG